MCLSSSTTSFRLAAMVLCSSQRRQAPDLFSCSLPLYRRASRHLTPPSLPTKFSYRMADSSSAVGRLVQRLRVTRLPASPYSSCSLNWMGFRQLGAIVGCDGDQYVGGECGSFTGSALLTTGIAWVSVVSPELVPVVCRLFTGVGPSSFVLFAFWSAGVGSGWCICLMYFSTGVGSGLLLVVSQWCHSTVIVERLGWSLDMGLSPTSKGVCSFVPSGILKLLTVLVSGPSNRSSFVYGGTLVLLWRRNNSCWAPSQDGLSLVVYFIVVSVVVSLTLATYHIHLSV